ncbi:acyl-[acyl-carrier-protein]--UDP-N-acetylglucosamine O-acyltransferase [Chlamydia muridarum str. Nigg]|jgi:acyl-[acyl-carrier-protein]--UDP-N-acetylglucosamine O-acyltransferase|uniref:Acyl-[acyl-carrier-protein]--UDP-N-acetylglucosamine O-acyltransferase n=2 Tax=Chlamydia muridarum TaxID=83560 RepID=LPXA_CHLMU|nr:acyl-ACP--UDP-N-acetylglucosamine O-acyltransferase [Chlamydia muridarum]Q9PJL1.1 RecName: Full=Acyl-[acyl-carrier-protein]--UDP-N-acetylglucosamine O-acyltransferase; Short=UDP-N-acetylglucosamine acyltransferase [Chlamydia muridarum str. Nigg]UFX24820.1 acyl-ACP--UDP-N-acetylglucosamine O-acyltransferase [Chlamydia trachomatis]AAF39620.1 acyl-(acyl-carrier-protein)--UDP-N-acetylglucosamine o-acyltransferase [Chlamydia muridarum str. Nigg]AHH23204.1 UDP-N-acetylglucosamine acyltransferase [
MTNIHPTAIVEDGAQIGNNVTIEPYAIVKKNVKLCDDVVVKSYAYIDGFTTIGRGTTIWPSAMIGNKPQDLKFKGEKTFVEIGEHCEIREFAMITSSTFEGTTVSIGNNCLIMPWAHIAHNCSVGNNVVFSTHVQLAGHVQVGDCVTIGSMVGVHQFVRIGSYAMVGAMSGIRRDIPPFTIGTGNPYALGGVNKVGLQRRRVPFETRLALIKTFKRVFRSGESFQDSLGSVLEDFGDVPEVRHFVEFCRQPSKRGIERGIDCEASLDEPIDKKEGAFVES